MTEILVERKRTANMRWRDVVSRINAEHSLPASRPPRFSFSELCESVKLEQYEFELDHPYQSMA